MPETIAERLRALLKAKGWKVSELGRRLEAVGVKNGRRVAQRYLSGTNVPGPRVLGNFAKAFETPVSELDPLSSASKGSGRRRKKTASDANKNPRQGVQLREGSADEFGTPALEELLSMMRNIPDQGPLMILGGALQSVPPERRLDFALHCANQARTFAAGRRATGTDPNK